jgi:hypothetical protein
MELQIGLEAIWIAPACTGGILDAGRDSSGAGLLSRPCYVTSIFCGSDCLQRSACRFDFVSAPELCVIASSSHDNIITLVVSSSDSRGGL